MSQTKFSILDRFMKLSITTAILFFAVFGCILYNFQPVTDHFDNRFAQTIEEALGIGDSQMVFSDIIWDIQNTLVYGHTNNQFATDVDLNIQSDDDEWAGIY